MSRDLTFLTGGHVGLDLKQPCENDVHGVELRSTYPPAQVDAAFASCTLGPPGFVVWYTAAIL